MVEQTPNEIHQGGVKLSLLLSMEQAYLHRRHKWITELWKSCAKKKEIWREQNLEKWKMNRGSFGDQ